MVIAIWVAVWLAQFLAHETSHLVTFMVLSNGSVPARIRAGAGGARVEVKSQSEWLSPESPVYARVTQRALRTRRRLVAFIAAGQMGELLFTTALILVGQTFQPSEGWVVFAWLSLAMVVMDLVVGIQRLHAGAQGLGDSLSLFRLRKTVGLVFIACMVGARLALVACNTSF